MTSREKIVPALGYSVLTPIYDVVVRHSTRENLFKSEIVQLARFRPGERVLDIGCGSGTLLKLAIESDSQAEFNGIDADPQMLAVARAKLENRAILHEGFSTRLPFANDSMDCAVSSLFFHHLGRESKLTTFCEAFRVLKVGGRLIVADWGQPTSLLMRGLFFQVQLLDGFANTRDNADGKLLDFMAQAGFSNCHESSRFSTVFGTISIYSAEKVERGFQFLSQGPQ